MRREITVLFLLLILIAASLLNIGYINRLSNDLCSQLDSIDAAAKSGEFETAIKLFHKSYKLWDQNKMYYGIFLRHPEIDSGYDCFYDLKAELVSENADAIPALCAKLKYHIQCLADMEKLKLSSIL